LTSLCRKNSKKIRTYVYKYKRTRKYFYHEWAIVLTRPLRK
jgi:hypothetical protein